LHGGLASGRFQRVGLNFVLDQRSGREKGTESKEKKDIRREKKMRRGGNSICFTRLARAGGGHHGLIYKKLMVWG